MSIQFQRLFKKIHDPCPACNSSDAKRPKGTLEKKCKSWGLHCTICKYSVMSNCDNSRKGNVKRFRKRLTARQFLKSHETDCNTSKTRET